MLSYFNRGKSVYTSQLSLTSNVPNFIIKLQNLILTTVHRCVLILIDCKFPCFFTFFFKNHKMTCHLPAMSVLNSPVMYFVPGFEITIDHPHTDVVKCTQLVRGRGFLLCSLCPLLLFIPPQMWVGRGKKTLLI